MESIKCLYCQKNNNKKPAEFILISKLGLYLKPVNYTEDIDA